MKVRNKYYGMLLVLCAFLLFPCCKQQSTKRIQNIALYLPESGEIDGWERERDLHTYMGDDLFLYINGGAEIYHEYGFKQVVVQDYKNAHERSLSVEIYKMINPAAAYGIYSFKKSPEGVPLEITSEGRLEGYYLNFWKGHYLVTITGFDEEDETVEGIKTIANTIAKNIPAQEDVQKPRLTNLLPKKDLVPGSEKYFKGNLGLFNTYFFSQQDIFDIKEGVRGAYTEGYDIYLIQYSDPQQSCEQFKSIEKSLSQDPRFTNISSSEAFFFIQDDKENFLYFSPIGKFIVIILGAKDFTSAENISKGIQFNVED